MKPNIPTRGWGIVAIRIILSLLSLTPAFAQTGNECVVNPLPNTDSTVFSTNDYITARNECTAACNANGFCCECVSSWRHILIIRSDEI
mmetsp:Transcript_3557/g.4515  ORF Transcript_3557/g.4515 Transcript_3557/m.4515 type:complete len:89 (+) Transcript_3557:103-369(+)